MFHWTFSRFFIAGGLVNTVIRSFPDFVLGVLGTFSASLVGLSID
ncbi:hypothetical protein EH5_01768 [Bacillus subtilis]|nr:hypothetical protein EH5_01768 [Bacillus subtilis]